MKWSIEKKTAAGLGLAGLILLARWRLNGIESGDGG